MRPVQCPRLKGVRLGKQVFEAAVKSRSCKLRRQWRRRFRRSGYPWQERRLLQGKVQDGIRTLGERQTRLVGEVACDVRQGGAPPEPPWTDSGCDAVDENDHCTANGLDHLLHLIASHRLAQDDSVRPGCEGGDGLVGGLQSSHDLLLGRGGEAAGERLDCEDGLEDDGGAAGKHLERALGNHILEVLQRKLDLRT